jgi:membrane dipeptidase
MTVTSISIDGAALHDDAIVIDALAGTTFAFDHLAEAGITAANLTLAAHNEGFLRAIEWIKDYYAAIQTHPDRLVLVRTAEDIRRAKQDRKLGLILGFQSASPIEDDLTHLWILAQLGVRIIQLTYMGANLVGCGCYETNDTGLTYLGKTLVREMNRLGILVDLSHCGWRTAEDAITLSTQPVVFTHSNPYEKCPNRRNPPGRLLKAAAEIGGVIGINGHPAICAVAQDRRPTFNDYMDVLDYTVDLVGIDHVGLGPDLFEGFTAWQAFRWDRRYDELDNPWGVTEGMAVESDIRRVAPELAQRGYSEIDIRKILGLNFLRVFEAVWTRPVV